MYVADNDGIRIPPKNSQTKLICISWKNNQKIWALEQFQKEKCFKKSDTHMMDICGEVEKLENTIKDYVEEDIKKKEILNILEKIFK